MLPGLRETDVPGRRVRYFTCPCAFQLRRLARNGAWGGIFPANFRIKWLLWHVHLHFDCADWRKRRNLAQTSCQETSFRELVGRSCQETSYGDLGSEILPRDLLQRSCQQSSYRVLVQRPGEESSDLVERSFIESLNRDLPWRSLLERSLQESFQRPLIEILYRDFARTPLMEILCRDSA